MFTGTTSSSIPTTASAPRPNSAMTAGISRRLPSGRMSLTGRLHPGPVGVLADQQDRLALGGHEQLPLLDGPGEVEEIGVLHDQRQLDPGLRQSRLEAPGAALDLRAGDEAPLPGREREVDGHSSPPLSEEIGEDDDDHARARR